MSKAKNQQGGRLRFGKKKKITVVIERVSRGRIHKNDGLARKGGRVQPPMTKNLK